METIYIKTSDNTEFSYEPAGAGSRFLAIVIDSTIKSIAVLAFWITIHALGTPFDLKHLIKDEYFIKSSQALSILFLGAFAGFIVIGYHIFFETLSNGQTPGKRVLGIRVIKDNGSSINIIDASIRNFLRTIDFLPSFYLVGALVVLNNPRCKRIGDIAAGTIVVKIPKEQNPISFPETEVEEMPQYESRINNLTDDEINLIRNYIARRSHLSVKTRKILNEKLAAIILKKLNLQENPLSDEEELLEWIVVKKG